MEERATEPTDVLEEGAVAPAAPPEELASVAGTTQAETQPKADVAPNVELEALRKEIAELKARPVPSADEIAQAVISDPRLKQSQRDMIAFQLKQQKEAEQAKLTAPIDAMEEAGEIDPAVAAKQRKAIAKQLDAEYAERLRFADQAQRQPSYPPAPNPEQQWAEQFLLQKGVAWDDVRAELNDHLAKYRVGMGRADFQALVERRAGEKRLALEKEVEARVRRQIEDDALRARESDRQGATKPPPGAGSPVDERSQFVKKFKNTGKVGEFFDRFPES